MRRRVQKKLRMTQNLIGDLGKPKSGLNCRKLGGLEESWGKAGKICRTPKRGNWCEKTLPRIGQETGDGNSG